MRVYDLDEIEKKLKNIPDRTIQFLKPDSLKQELSIITNQFETRIEGKGCIEALFLFPGIFLTFFTFRASSISVRHHAFPSLLQITFCHRGRLGWTLDHDGHIYLGPGDMSVHRMDTCTDSILNLPFGYYEGITLFISPQNFKTSPPGFLQEAGITDIKWLEKFCIGKEYATFPGDGKIRNIFSVIYDSPEHLRDSYCKLKVLELFLYLSTLSDSHVQNVSSCPPDQAEVIKQIHDYLLQNLGKRITIEELSKRYLINTSTLKDVFKSVYGGSIAAHMKEHRLEEGARLLLETNDSIAQIAKKVGYESQSKFSLAFKEMFHVLPTEYRKKRK